MDPTYPHDIIGGTEALLAGVGTSNGEKLTEYQWEFGDGTKSDRMPVTEPLALEAKHSYEGPVGQVFRATLVVWDDTGASGRDDYYVRIRPRTLRTRAQMACQFALWNLHKRMSRYQENGVQFGYWETHVKSHRVGITAACLQAFQNLGYFPFDDPEESPYVEDVRRAFNQLLLDMKSEPISPQNAGDPDLNGNGIGLVCHRDQGLQHLFSSQGLAMMALVMSRDPHRIAPVGEPNVRGRTFLDIVQDMAEFIAFGQTDENPEEIVARGGWRYDRPNSGEADMATTEWPVSGLLMAEANWSTFGVQIPSWVKMELRDNFLTADYNAETGGWHYIATPSSHANVALTGIGLLCCAWTGVPFDDPMVQSGFAYIAANWNSTDSDGLFGHFTSMFSMYAIASAMKAYDTATIGEHAWYQEYAEYLLANQNSDGSWSSQGYEKSWPLTAAWAVLILLEPQIPPSVVMDPVESAQQGPVSLAYCLFDDNYDECNLVVEFSTDAGETWTFASQIDGDPLVYAEATPEGSPRLFVWDTESDLGQVNLDNILVRVTPYDGEKGEPGRIVVPGIYNDVVPFERVEIDAPLANGRGVAAADFDNDGDTDIFVANLGQEDFLFRNDAGTLVETATVAGMGGVFPSNCGVWADFNNDGALDLYLVLNGKANRLYKGNGSGSFTEVTSRYGGNHSGGGTCAAWGDYNSDHRLDFYVGNDTTSGSGTNALYHNWGAGGFSNLAGPLGVDCPWSTQATTWGDFDNDGSIDLYVANDSSSSRLQNNYLFHNISVNLETPFQDVTEEAGLSDPRCASAAVWADFNNDGAMDIFSVNSGSDDNLLYLNEGDGTFRRETETAGLRGPANARGATVADCDNDGDLDIFLSANGKDCLYLNRGDCTFVEVATLAGIEDIADSRGAAWVDVNGDGFLDLYVAHDDAKDVLYLNRGEARNWLTVRCLTDADGDATDDNQDDDRDAIGAVVAVDLDGDMDFSSEYPDRLAVQHVDGGSGYRSQGQLWPHFGLKRYAAADIRVTFPDGSVVYQCGSSANQIVVIRDIAPTGDFYVKVFTPQVPRSGNVIIGYLIFNSSESECDVRVERSLNGGVSWQLAPMAQGRDGTQDLLSSPLGVFHTFLWDSIRDVGFTNHDDIRIRITPLRPEPGQPGETADFSVYNNTVPEAIVQTPAGVATGSVPIRYTLSDLQSDDCSLRVEYSTDGGKSWALAAAGPAGDGVTSLASSPQGLSHVFIWDSFANIGHSVRNNLKIRITPSDRYNHGPAAETGFFAVNNNLPPSAIIETPSSTQTGDVVLRYHLLDLESDLCSVEVSYSLDGGRSWVPAAMAAGGEGTAGLSASPSGKSHRYVWDSIADLGDQYSAAVRITVAPRDSRYGPPAQSGDFVVDNLRPAELAFSPASLSFSAEKGGEPPTPQTLEVWNKGSHSLEWSAETDAGWIVVFPGAGVSSGERDAIEVAIDTTNLFEGVYAGNITLSAPDAIGSPAVIPVTLDISPPPPSLFVSDSLLNFIAEEGGDDPLPQSFMIRNEGGGDMLWQVEANQEWIGTSPTSGSSAGESDFVEVHIHTGGLSVGSYAGTITISAPEATNSPQVISVSLEIQPAPPKLSVSPKELSFVTRRGGPNPPEQELQLTISGGSSVAWQAHEEADWLSLSPSSGTNAGEETVIRVAVEKSALNIGTYRTEIVFEAVTAPLGTQKVVVTLDVVPIVVPDDFRTIQGAINDALHRDIVSVKPGIYRENIHMKSGVDVVGAGAALTTIRSASPSSVVAFEEVEDSLLEGFAITGGSGDFFGRESRLGGGVYCANTRATIRRCFISDNSAAWGGGVCLDRNSDVILQDCQLSENSAAGGGGVFCYENCRVTFLRSRVSHNSATQYGGGGCVISDASILLRSCEVCGNSARLGGGGVFAEPGATVDSLSCTFADNLGEGILAMQGSSVAVTNTILWSNTDELVIPMGQSVRFCDIGSGDFAGSEGNISADPRFVAADEGCYDLLPDSPCIDRGSNMVPELPETDIHGEPRIVAVTETPTTDIGADEHDPDRIIVLTQPDPQLGAGGQVTVPFSLWNARNLPANISVEFSIGGSEWRPASRAGGEGTMDLTSSPSGSPHSFTWDSVPDLEGESPKSVRVRIRLAGQDARPGATTDSFSLDNTLSDSDNDGLPDAWEEAVVSANPDDDLASIADVLPAGDPDGDRSDNLTEYLARTDPLDPQSSFKASCTPEQGATMLIRWESVAGRFYQVYKLEEMGGHRVAVGERQAGTGGTLTVIDETVTEDTRQGFYLISVE